MRITRKDEIEKPLSNPGGEEVYELIGASEATGGTSGHSLAHILIRPGASSHPHYHKISEETYYILRGEARMQINGKVLTLYPGHTILIEPGEEHLISNQGKDDLEFLAVSAPPWNPEDSYDV